MDWSSLDAVLFDLDGVITPTAEVHRHAWAQMFGAYLEQRGAAPYTEDDYFAHLDGKPRYEGVADLLASRDIDLPHGDPSDDPSAETVCGLGNRKNVVFSQVLQDDGVEPYPGSVRFLDAVIARGTQVAIVSSSANAPVVLEAARVADRFGVVVDGAVARDRSLAGKPEPETFLFAAAELGVPRERAVVVEDALSGVQAGRAGGFALVVGVDRGAGEQALLDHGADVVVQDLDELVAGLEGDR
ncbi:MAG: beta-phosphoglucomutase family hydrolase [Nocardioidaceae bacterium]|nr:beta-phosphoglucomutase family hydrolase [Nocardioidaceae bacterium]